MEDVKRGGRGVQTRGRFGEYCNSCWKNVKKHPNCLAEADVCRVSRLRHKIVKEELVVIVFSGMSVMDSVGKPE